MQRLAITIHLVSRCLSVWWLSTCLLSTKLEFSCVESQYLLFG